MILTIDGTNLAFVMNSIGSLSTKDGFPTQAISGFLNVLRSYIVQLEPTKVFMAWDGGSSKKRLTLHPGYKESRKKDRKSPEQKMNFEEMLAQLPIIKQTVRNLGLYNMEGAGVEGDDLIALMVKKADQLGEQTVIVSSDLDFHQLVTENVSVYSTLSKKAFRHVTFDNFSEAHDGLKPDQFLDFKALQGDKSDDIPGVKGIGPTTAKKILLEFDSVDNWRSLVDSGEHKPNKTQQKIITGWESYQLSKSMIDLHKPLADFSTAKIHQLEPDWPAVRAMALEYQIGKIFVDFSTWIRPFKGLR